MFSALRQSITRQVNRVRREFQEVIRPVVDRAVENSFERYRQRGAVGNNPINSSNPNSHNLFTDFFARHPPPRANQSRHSTDVTGSRRRRRSGHRVRSRTAEGQTEMA